MLLGLVALLVCCGPVAGAGPEAPGPMAVLDTAFKDAYRLARTKAFDHQGPVLVVAGDRLLLYRDQAVVAEAVHRSELYHRLKAVAHVPLSVALLAGSGVGQPLAPGTAAALGELRSGVGAALDGAEGLFPGGTTLQRQRLILEASRRFLDGVLAADRVSAGGLAGYTQAMKGPIQGNIRQAAALELAALDRVVPAWRRDQLATCWDRVKVVVIGSHMAREGEVSWQYFSRLLGQDCAGGRLVFAEGLWEPKEALGLLATHGVDRALGEAFFGDPGRTHRDVLAEAAKKWLEVHAPLR